MKDVLEYDPLVPHHCGPSLCEHNGLIEDYETSELIFKFIVMARRECYHGRVCIDVRYPFTCFRRIS